MLIAVRPQLGGTFELEPVEAEFRIIVTNLNYVSNSCIAYIEDEVDKEVFISTLADDVQEQLLNNKRVEVDIALDKFLQYFPDYIM